MTANVSRSTSGGFATSRRTGATAEYDFIVSALCRGISVQNIARMTGCAMQDISRIKERVDVE